MAAQWNASEDHQQMPQNICLFLLFFTLQFGHFFSSFYSPSYHGTSYLTHKYIMSYLFHTYNSYQIAIS